METKPTMTSDDYYELAEIAQMSVSHLVGQRTKLERDLRVRDRIIALLVIQLGGKAEIDPIALDPYDDSIELETYIAAHTDSYMIKARRKPRA